MNHTEVNHPIERALRATFGRGQTVVAAVSGGPDSMAMFHALCALARECEWRVVAAHFDHRLRGDSHVDCALVRRAAESYGVRFVTEAREVGTHAYKSHQSREAAARELRYQFLERVTDGANADAIVTAHTHDDQVETVMMRLLRGAGARGRRAIHARRGRIVRPLLAVAHADTVAYCGEHAVAFVEDPSNHELCYERNRVRHEVLPALRRVYPGLDEMLVRIAHAAEMEFARASRVVDGRVRRFLRHEAGDRWLLDIDAFTGLDREDCSYLINAVLETMDARTDVSELHHEMLLDLIAADVGAISYLPGLRVCREHDGLVFAPPGSELPRHAFARALQVPGTLAVDNWRLDADRVDMPSAAQLSNSGEDTAYIPCDDILVVRYPRAGDRMQPFGMSGHKKLSDVFIDHKIPKRKRARTPVIEVGGEILWVVGVATSEKCRIGEGASGVVRLTATRASIL